MKQKPKVFVLSRSDMERRFGRSGLVTHAFTKGNHIYVTNKTSEFDIEHEKAHYNLGHVDKATNMYQYVIKEINADKEACIKLGKPFKHKYLVDIAATAYTTFKPKGYISPEDKNQYLKHIINAVNSACKTLGIRDKLELNGKLR